MQSHNDMQDSHQAPSSDTDLTSGAAAGQTKPVSEPQLCIEQALHVLPLPPAIAQSLAGMATAGCAAAGGGSQRHIKVLFDWAGVGRATPAVALTQAGSAKWQYTTELPVAEPHASLSTGAEAETNTLQLQVLMLLYCFVEFPLGSKPAGM